MVMHGTSHLVSANFPSRRVRHRNYEVWQDEFEESEGFAADSSFNVHQSKGYVRFEAVNFPNYYIRHQGFQCFLREDDGSDAFAQDSSFLLVPALNGDGRYASLQSANFPTHHLRHKGHRLLITETEGPVEDFCYEVNGIQVEGHGASFYGADAATLLAWFGEIDVSGTDSLCTSDVRKLLARAGVDYSAKAVHSMMRLVETTGNGRLSAAEFLRMHGILKSALYTFQASDVDSSGTLGLVEVSAALQRHGFYLDLAPEGSFYSLCKSFDFEQSASLSLESFLHMFVTLFNAQAVHRSLVGMHPALSFDQFVWSLAQV